MGIEGLARIMRLDHFNIQLARQHAAAASDYHGMIVDDENAHGARSHRDFDFLCRTVGGFVNPASIADRSALWIADGVAIFTERQPFLLFEPVQVCVNFEALDHEIAALDWHGMGRRQPHRKWALTIHRLGP